VAGSPSPPRASPRAEARPRRGPGAAARPGSGETSYTACLFEPLRRAAYSVIGGIGWGELGSGGVG
jgi:hypothetical protein